MAEKRLKEMKNGERGKIIKVSGRSRIRSRITDMGVIKGAIVEMERAAPLGDPVEIKIGDYHLSLRKNEAENIYVEPLDG